MLDNTLDLLKEYKSITTISESEISDIVNALLSDNITKGYSNVILAASGAPLPPPRPTSTTSAPTSTSTTTTPTHTLDDEDTDIGDSATSEEDKFGVEQQKNMVARFTKWAKSLSDNHPFITKMFLNLTEAGKDIMLHGAGGADPNKLFRGLGDAFWEGLKGNESKYEKSYREYAAALQKLYNDNSQNFEKHYLNIFNATMSGGLNVVPNNLVNLFNETKKEFNRGFTKSASVNPSTGPAPTIKTAITIDKSTYPNIYTFSNLLNITNMLVNSKSVIFKNGTREQLTERIKNGSKYYECLVKICNIIAEEGKETETKIEECLNKIIAEKDLMAKAFGSFLFIIYINLNRDLTEKQNKDDIAIIISIDDITGTARTIKSDDYYTALKDFCNNDTKYSAKAGKLQKMKVDDTNIILYYKDGRTGRITKIEFRKNNKQKDGTLTDALLSTPPSIKDEEFGKFADIVTSKYKDKSELLKKLENNSPKFIIK